jgi:selenide,water dikinase
MNRSRADSTGPEAPREVVLVGGGHAHVQVLAALAMEPLPDARLTVVVDTPIAVYSGMVPGLVAGQYRRPDLEIDVAPLARRAGARLIIAAATGIDTKRRRIELADRPSIPYDVAAFDIGSTVVGLDLPGVGEHALPTRPIAWFVAAVDELVDLARRTSGSEPFRIAVVGAGAGGVELAFTLDARLEREGCQPQITLLQSASRLLLGSPTSLVRRVERHARRRAIAIRTGARVEAVAAGRIRLADGDELAADAVVWVTGAAPHGVLSSSDLATDRRGFVSTRSTLQMVDHDELFAVGDCATLIEHPDTPKAGVYAVRQGPHLTDNLRRFLAGRPLEPYRPQRDFLTLLNLGDGSALGTKWGLSFEGRWVMRLKDRIDRAFMRRFQVLTAEGTPSPEFIDRPAMDSGDEMRCGGCAAKLGRRPLARALTRLPLPPSESVVEIGLSAPDDAAVWHTAAGARIATSVDLFSALTDDPYLVGRIAAVNALSDLWAKGATARVAQAIVALPEELEGAAAEETLFQVLAGARRELDGFGVTLAGGHTTTAPGKLLVGFAVEGEIPSGGRILRKGGLVPGDALILTKPLGTGVVFAADMRARASGRWIEAAAASMLRPNRPAARLAAELAASAATDVTGFGLAGHLVEMLSASGLGAELELATLPALPGALELLAQDVRSTFHADNAAQASAFAIAPAAERSARLALLFDPQTSGGLLVGIAAERAERLLAELRAGGDEAAAIVGRVTPPRTDGHQCAVG